MKKIEELSESTVNLSKSTKDSNKFYSILLDARATTVSENTYDIAERLLRGETDNAKAALEHLWSLKKTMQQESGEATTIDMLIQYYQKKMDVVRTKEEFIKKISRDSRTLLEEKRTRDSEIATIKQEITDCTAEVQELSAKLEKLKVKEQELTLIDSQLKKELLVNENEIINGLYEIILSQQEGENPVAAFTEKLANQASTEPGTEGRSSRFAQGNRRHRRTARRQDPRSAGCATARGG
jgi:seryl-tRNA synthetase